MGDQTHRRSTPGVGPGLNHGQDGGEGPPGQRRFRDRLPPSFVEAVDLPRRAGPAKSDTVRQRGRCSTAPDGLATSTIIVAGLLTVSLASRPRAAAAAGGPNLGDSATSCYAPGPATHRWPLELPRSGVNPPGPLPVMRRDLAAAAVYALVRGAVPRVETARPHTDTSAVRRPPATAGGWQRRVVPGHPVCRTLCAWLRSAPHEEARRCRRPCATGREAMLEEPARRNRGRVAFPAPPRWSPTSCWWRW